MSKSYGTINADLRRAFASVIKKICTGKLSVDTTKDETPFEAFLACRFIPLDENPGLRPIGVGEVLRRIAGKVVMKVVKEDIKKAAGCLQLCVGQEAGCEAAIHAMHKIFESNETVAILIVDAENAFNSINCIALLHNIEYLCPAIATFLYNCYAISPRLFIGGKELRSREGTTQGDPTAMAAYALGLTPLLYHLQSVKRSVKHAAFADDLTGARNLEEIKIWWDILIIEGPKYGYYPKPLMSFLIVKQHYKEYAERIFAGSNIKITTKGVRHLVAVLGDISFKEEYLQNEVHSWKNQLEILSKIAEIQPQAAYSAYMFRFKHEFTFFLQTLPDIADYLLPIEETLRSRFIPAITGGHICSDAERALLALPVKFSGLGLQNRCEVANTELLNSKEITR